MGNRSNNEIKTMITKDISNIHNYCLDVKKFINDQFEDTVDYLHSLIAEIPQSVSGPSNTKMLNVLKKKGIQRVETIPENDIINIDNTVSDSTAIHDKIENKDIKTGDVIETTIGRAKREASRKAAVNIKKQQSMSLAAKLRRPLTLDDDSNINRKRESRSKKKESARSSSDEKNTQGPTKHSRTEKSVLGETISRRIAGTSQIHSQDHLSVREDAIQPEKIEPLKSSMATRNSNIKRTFSQSENTKDKNSNVIDDTVIAPTENDIEELSICKGTLEKFTPLMNSTMDVNSTYTRKMMNATVILESLSPIKLNETVVINKNMVGSIGENNELKFTSRASITLQEKMQQLKEAVTNKEFDELLTEDESCPEVKKSKANIKKQEIKKQQKRHNRSMTSSENAIPNTPTKPFSKEKNTITGFQKRRNTYNSNALFDPYAKVSVKKRIEAFEQADMNTPKLAVDIDAATRITRTTRTKTREQNAGAAAQTEASGNANIGEKAIAHKLARKSVAKAKKILSAKQSKDVDERRKEEEQQRLQRLQEQEGAERILAEQRRREQKAERRKEAELRAQRQAAAEVMKTKHQMITSQVTLQTISKYSSITKAQAIIHSIFWTKYGCKQHGPTTTYVLNSEPDDDESNDESRPKYTIPHWAQSHVRENQLAMQRYIPEKAVYNFFDSRKCTPDLTEMFENINRSRLERTSSAIWKTPPRYSMMESK